MATIICDVDDVVANLIDKWLAEYNIEYNDTLTKDKITDWNISYFVKPECSEKIYNFLDRNIYNFIQPIPDSLRIIKKLKENNRVVFATMPAEGSEGIKYQWLFKHGYLNNRRDYVETHDKNLLKGDVIIDDNLDFVNNFDDGKVLFAQPWNQNHGDFPKELVAKNWNDVKNILNWSYNIY